MKASVACNPQGPPGNAIELFLIGSYGPSGMLSAAREEGQMAELSEEEKQSLDDALSTLDDLYEAILKPDFELGGEQRSPS